MAAEAPRVSFPEIEKTEKADDDGNRKSIFDFRVEDEAALVSSKKFGFFSSREKKASAPNNLPIAEEFDLKIASGGDMMKSDNLKEAVESASMEKDDEFVLDMGGGSIEETDGQDASIGTGAKNREATPEEVKMRLNKLLGKK
jgi:hypothetical protein